MPNAISDDQVNTLLFDDEDSSNEGEERLLRQRGISVDDEELEPVPYWKRPIIQISILAAIAVPFTWALVSAFSSNQAPPEEQEVDPFQQENQGLKESLAKERERTQDLEVEMARGQQRLEVFPVEEAEETSLTSANQQSVSAPPSAPAPQPSPPPVRTAQPTRTVQPPPPRTVRSVPRQSAQPVVYRPQPQPQPQPAASSPSVPTQTQAAPPEPELSPQEKWLQHANRGHYLSGDGTPYRTETQSAIYRPSEQTNEPLLAAYSGRAESSNLLDSSTRDAAPLIPPPTLNRSSAFAAPVPHRSTLEERTANDLNPLSPSHSSGSWRDIFSQNRPSDVGFEQTEQVLNVGSHTSARLESGVAWTQESQDLGRQYLLTLKEPFNNRDGVQVLPEGTRLIAQVSELSSSGLFYMEVTTILQQSGEEIQVPPSSLQILAKDGSPLKADLKQKGGPSFLDTVGSIVAPGVEEAMDSIADSTESLVLEDGDRSIIRSNGGSRSPVAAGLSGVASGASRVFGNQLDNNQRQQAVPYFQFDSGKTVRIMVYQDFALPVSSQYQTP